MKVTVVVMLRMSAGSSFQASGAAVKNDLDPKVTFERKLSDVAYTLVQVFTCESQLSPTERVLLLKVFFRKQ